MKNEFLKRNLLLLSAIVLLCFSCSDDDSTNIGSQEITSAEIKTVLEADNIAQSVDNILTEAFMDNTGERKAVKRSSACYEGTYSDTSFTLTFENCTVDGEIINGSISVVNTSEGDNISFSATFNAFSVGGIGIDGTRSFEFIGDIDEASYSFSVTSDLTVTFEDSSVISIDGDRTFVFTFGDSLETSTYTIAGNWTVQIDGNTYSVVVTDTLEGNLACEYITTGNMTLAKNGLVVDVDFGNGTCDDQATVTYPDSTTEEVSLDD